MPTNLETASLEAFDDLVSHAGKTFSVGNEAVQGIVQFIEPENARYSLEAGEEQDAIVQVKKEEWPAASMRQGTSFEITGSHSFRIKSTRSDTYFNFMRCKVY